MVSNNAGRASGSAKRPIWGGGGAFIAMVGCIRLDVFCVQRTAVSYGCSEPLEETCNHFVFYKQLGIRVGPLFSVRSARVNVVTVRSTLFCATAAAETVDPLDPNSSVCVVLPMLEFSPEGNKSLKSQRGLNKYLHINSSGAVA